MRPARGDSEPWLLCHTATRLVLRVHCYAEVQKLYGLAELPREFSRLVPLARARMSAPQWCGRSYAVYAELRKTERVFFFGSSVIIR